MHDDLLERRLSAAFHEEADSLPFTITAAELERRLAVRRQTLVGRRVTLLLAAAVAIGLLGVGGALSGRIDRTLPAPTTLAAVDIPTPTAATAQSRETVAPQTASPTSPVALTQALPGWRISAGLGPDLAAETHTMSLGGAGAGEDHIQVVLACTGTTPIEVSVDDGKVDRSRQHVFEATCAPDGRTTSQIFKVSEGGVAVRYLAPKGTWTALSVLVPDATH